MKMLTKRTEIAKAANFGRYPVLTIDLADADKSGLRGCKVRIDGGKFPSGDPYIVRAEIRVFRDEQKLTTFSSGVMISNSFTFGDYKEIAEYASAPMIKADQDVLVMVYNSAAREAYAAAIVHTAKYVDHHCVVPLAFEDADFSDYMMIAGMRGDK